MRGILVSAVGLSALALSAGMSTTAYAGASLNYGGVDAAPADGTPLKTPAALDCPASQGALTRTAQAADGRSCDYQGAAGETVRLRLVALEGRSATEAMAPTKAELHALVPIYNRPVPAVDKDEPGDRADIDLPFFHVHTRGDHAEVRMFGVKIHSEGDNADVNVGHGHKHTVVHAGAGGAEVVAEDVGRSNASLVYVLASDRRMSSGYCTVGYVAKGPAKGPLVVGEFRDTQKRHTHDDGDHGDIGRLIDRNFKG
ncbi:MAG TPA: hypothetical protein VHN39_02435 [Phenylobacterium sp.]|jgi:hypothetical protein|nr:hypothetical protein [Phenylobacterium sp.]